MSWKHRTWMQEQDVVRLSKDHSQAEIAELVGISKWSVFDVQRKYHVVLMFGRSYSSSQFRYKWDKREWGLVIEELYVVKGFNMKQTARVLGIHVDTLARRMDALEINRINKRGKGKKRGPHSYFAQFPVCITKGCETRVMTEGEDRCAACRRSRMRQAGRKRRSPNLKKVVSSHQPTEETT